MADEIERIRVEVAVAWPELQVLVPVVLERDATLEEAIERSGLRERFPGLEISRQRVGVFAQLRAPDTRLCDGDRVEIYRPLKIDPKEARRMAAEAKVDR